MARQAYSDPNTVDGDSYGKKGIQHEDFSPGRGVNWTEPNASSNTDNSQWQTTNELRQRIKDNTSSTGSEDKSKTEGDWEDEKCNCERCWCILL
jgi:hypothetical protein